MDGSRSNECRLFGAHDSRRMNRTYIEIASVFRLGLKIIVEPTTFKSAFARGTDPSCCPTTPLEIELCSERFPASTLGMIV